MGQQSVRQAARRAALEQQRKRRQEREEADRRRSALGVDITVALSERDAHVQRLELAAGTAITRLTRDEGLSVEEAIEWADGVTAGEARRLRRLAEDRQGS